MNTKGRAGGTHQNRVFYKFLQMACVVKDTLAPENG